MATQTKQRIIGILVLLFLALIILPWVFGGRQQIVFDNKVDDKKLVKSESTDFENMTEEPNQSVESQPQAQTVQPTPEVKPESQETIMPEPRIKPGPTSAKVAVIEEDDQTNVAQVPTEKMSQIQNKVMHTEAKQAPVSTTKASVHKVAVQNRHHVKKETPALAELDAPEATTPAKSVKKPTKNWQIQLGSFSDSDNATKLVKQLKDLGFNAYTKPSKNAQGDEVTRVLVGQNADHISAESAVTSIEKRLKIHGVIVKAKS